MGDRKFDYLDIPNTCTEHENIVTYYNSRLCPQCLYDCDVYVFPFNRLYLPDTPDYIGQHTRLLVIRRGNVVIQNGNNDGSIVTDINHDDSQHQNRDENMSRDTGHRAEMEDQNGQVHTRNNVQNETSNNNENGSLNQNDCDLVMNENDNEIVKQIIKRKNITHVKLNVPPDSISPENYLRANIRNILLSIHNSQVLLPNRNYRVGLSFTSTYRRSSELILDSYDIRVLHDTTHFRTILSLTQGFNEDLLGELCEEVAKKYGDTVKALDGSGWQYLYTSDISLTFVQFSGRKVLSFVKNINNYVPYPQYRRGKHKVINILNDNLPNDRDVCYGPSRSRCVTLALKAHMINSHMANGDEKDIIMKDLLKNGEFYRDETKDALMKQKVEFPANVSNEFTMRDWSKLERSNQTPIIVYNLMKHKSKKEVVYLTCIRAPKQKTFNKFRVSPTCHIVMLSSDHCAYIPDMVGFMKTIFNKPLNKTRNRCKLCFAQLIDSNSLSLHLTRGACFGTYSQPPIVRLNPEAKLKHCNLTDEIQPDLICIMDTEALLKKIEETDGEVVENNDTSVSNDFTQVREVSADQFYHSVNNIGERDTIARDASDPNVVNKHVPMSFGAVFLDHNKQPLDYITYFGEDTGELFLGRIHDEIAKQMERIGQSKCYKPYLNKEDWLSFNTKTTCMFCNRKFKNSKNKHQHHDHHIIGEEEEIRVVKANGSTKKMKRVTKSNYVGASCSQCNLAVTGKRRQAVCIFHNGTSYDLPLLMKGMCSDKKNIKHIKVLPKGKNSYYNVKYKNASFIDSCSFLTAPLDKLVDLLCSDISADRPQDTIPITVKIVGEKYGPEILDFVGKKGVYPYDLATSCDEMFTITEWPAKEKFYNVLKDCHISDEDYIRGKRMWQAAQCKNLKDLHDIYLMLDVCLLADIWCWFTNVMVEDFSLNPANFLTGPSMVFKAALKIGKTDIELLDNADFYESFEGMLRGGYVNVNSRKISCNNVDMGSEYDPTKNDIFFFFIDFNALYAEQLCKPLPYANFQKCDPEIFKNTDFIMNIDTGDDATVGYILTTNIQIPVELRKYFDDFPLGLINTSKIVPSPHSQSLGGMGGQEKLIGGHFDLCEYTFHIKLLQFYLSIGCVLTDVHTVISFYQKPIFLPYV